MVVRFRGSTGEPTLVATGGVSWEQWLGAATATDRTQPPARDSLLRAVTPIVVAAPGVEVMLV
jgi:hypothetical protein